MKFPSHGRRGLDPIHSDADMGKRLRCVPEDRECLWKQGYRFFNVASDFRLIGQGPGAAIEDARRSLEPAK
ncbi:MAG: hypothetical protein HN457_14645 [Opitutales bacterium]|jgi:hypothetical protein|nr:hypothetical protein [Opitutales bacterium]MBT5168348.1 hypothetical protein [Opitutales bacterium]MBT5813801.1 hypothetical protein [Opitutales bacterium]MBT6380969.1 hypothetical protein [Opitutales bacterium]